MNKTPALLGLLACVSLSAAEPVPTPHWSVTWKRLFMTGPGLEQVGVLPARSAKELGPNIYWSVGCETLDRDYGDFQAYKPYIGELGVTSARIQSGWAKCEQKKGRYDFAWLDTIVDGMLEEGVRQEIAWGEYAIGDDVPGLTRKMVSDYIHYLGNLRWQSLGFGTLYPGFEDEPEDMSWVSKYSNANMVKTDFFEARSTAYAKSTALVDDL